MIETGYLWSLVMIVTSGSVTDMFCYSLRLSKRQDSHFLPSLHAPHHVPQCDRYSHTVIIIITFTTTFTSTQSTVSQLDYC